MRGLLWQRASPAVPLVLGDPTFFQPRTCAPRPALLKRGRLSKLLGDLCRSAGSDPEGLGRGVRFCVCGSPPVMPAQRGVRTLRSGALGDTTWGQVVTPVLEGAGVSASSRLRSVDSPARHPTIMVSRLWV